VAVGGEVVLEDSAVSLSMGDFFSAPHLSDVVDRLLFDRLLSFSPRPAMTNSGCVLTSF
jgi:hypothetical protein